MRKFLLTALAALFLTGATFTPGDLPSYYPDGILGPGTSNGSQIQDSGIPATGIAPHVATNIALSNSTRAQYPNGVWRDDYAASNGAPASFWFSQISSCAANLYPNTLIPMVSDGGACQDAHDGNSFVTAIPAAGLDVRQFGAKLDGTDASAALQNAFTWVVNTGGKLLAPAGKITWGTPISVTLPNSALSINFAGAGKAITYLAYTGTGVALTVNYQHVLNATHWRDFTMTTSHAGTAEGILLTSSLPTLTTANMATNTIDGVGWQGADGGLATDYFSTALDIVGVDTINLTDTWIAGSSTFQGVGVAIAAKTNACCAVQYNFQTPIYQSLAKGIYVKNNFIQTVSVTAGSLSNANNIYVDATATVGVQGIAYVNGTATVGPTVNVQGQAADIYIAYSDLFATPGNFALLLANDNGAIFTGNTVAATTNASGGGVSIGTSITSGGVFITNNQFYNLATGVTLGTGTLDAIVHDNNYTGTTTPIVNNATTNTGNRIGHPALLAFGSLGTTLTAATTYFCSLGCSSSLEPTLPFPANGSTAGIYVDQLQILQNTAPGGAVSNVYTWRCNGVNSTITTTLTGATAFNRDTTHGAFFFNGGSELCDVGAVIGAGAVASQFQGTVRVGLNP